MRESEIESAVVKYAEKFDVLCLKLNGPGDRGKPDRLFVRKGKFLVVEFKRTGEAPTALQEKWLDKFRRQGVTAGWVDSIEGGMDLIDQHIL